MRILPGGPGRLAHLFARYAFSPLFSPVHINVVFAIVIGLVTAVGAHGFKWLIDACTHLLLGGSDPGRHGVGGLLGRYDVYLVPALGGLVAGPIITRWAREARGHGVPEVMKAVITKGGRIRPVVAIVKIVASAITIGSGGSAGSEGPIVQIGAALGSSLGQLFHMPPKRITTMLACGSAAGIAAIFNAPIAGVLFSMEVILGGFEKVSFSYIVLSSVASSSLSQYLNGNRPVFGIVCTQLTSSFELVAFAVLGVLAALGARAFTELLVRTEDFFASRVRGPDSLKPALGGLCLGVFLAAMAAAFGMPAKLVCGVGYPTIDLALRGDLAFNLLLLLMAAKALATCCTLGSGGSGGIFAPTLYMGAMLGGAFGTVLGRLIPHSVSPPGLYAVVGMGAFFAGAAHAPMTAIMILFEMTGYHYAILLPIMTCSVVSVLVASLLGRDSIYTVRLRRQGIITEPARRDPLQSMITGEIMIRDPQHVSEEMSVTALSELVATKLHTSLPVVNAQRELVGVMTYREMHRALRRGISSASGRVKDYMNRTPVIAYPDESCADVFRRMRDANQGIAPVVKRQAPRRMVGIVTYRHVYEAYQQALKD